MMFAVVIDATKENLEGTGFLLTFPSVFFLSHHFFLTLSGHFRVYVALVSMAVRLSVFDYNGTLTHSDRLAE